MDLKNDSVKYIDVRRLAWKRWDIASSDVDDRGVGIDTINPEIYVEDMEF